MAAGVDTSTIFQERRDFDYSKRIAELEPDAGPLTTLLKKLGKTTVDTAEFRWFEYERNPRWATRVGAAEESPSDQVSVAAGQGTYFRSGDLIKVPRTGEVILVLSASGDTLNVVRGYGVTAAASLNDQEPLLIISNAYQENSVPGPMKVGQPTKVYNYVQIIKNPVSISGTLNAEKQRANPKERARIQKQAGIEHLIDIEYALWFGEPKEELNATPDGPRRTTGGVLYFAKDNVLDVASENGGTLTYALMEQWLEEAMRYGSRTKWLFASARLVSVLDTLAENKLQVKPRAETYGVSVRTWVSAHGELNIVKHHLFEGEEYGHMGVLLDLNTPDLAYVHLAGRDTRLRVNIGEPARDGYMDSWESDVGLRFPLSKRHGVITGVQQAG